MTFWKKVIEEYPTLKIVIVNLQIFHRSNNKNLLSKNENKFFKIFTMKFWKGLIEEYLTMKSTVVNLPLFQNTFV